MRVFLTAAILLLIDEAIIGLAFLAGYHWWGGVLRGLLTAAAVIIVGIAPWIGDLVIDFDSASRSGVVRLAWWGRVSLQMGGPRTVRISFLGIPIRRIAQKPEEPRPRRVIKSQRILRRRMWRWLQRNLERIVPPLLAAGHLAHAFFWDAREIDLTLQSPTQFTLADQMIAKLIGSPKLGTLQLHCLYPGKRRIAFHYRIGLLRIFVAAVVALAQARPLKAMRSAKQAQRQWQASTVEVAPGGPPQ